MASTDPFASFKETQREAWEHFTPLQVLTTTAAARLVRYADVHAGQRVLDVACGTGVVAVTAAQQSAEVTGIDLTPKLLEEARDNTTIAGVKVEWRQGDVEALPFADGYFDVVLSQFGHIFAPRPAVAMAEMLRVLKRGGTIAFSTWPPELMIGRSFQLTARYAPPPPAGVAPPPQWGVPSIVLERLGDAVTNVVFDRGVMPAPALSLGHYRRAVERSAGPIMKLVEALSKSDPARLAEFRAEFDNIVKDYRSDNVVRQEFLMTKARKK